MIFKPCRTSDQRFKAKIQGSASNLKEIMDFIKEINYFLKIRD